MNKIIVSIWVGLFLIGCGQEGGNSPSVSDTTTQNGPECKPLRSVWNSTTDLEQHDFGKIYLTESSQTSYERYTYRTANGDICSDNPYITAYLILDNDSAHIKYGFQGKLQLKYSDPAVGVTCQGRFNGYPNSAYRYKHTCNTLTLCEGFYVNGVETGPYNCKLFN